MTTPTPEFPRRRKAPVMSQPPARQDSPGTEPGALPAAVIRGRHHRLELVIWGAHGGAGTTTLATWLQPARDAGVMSPGAQPALPAAVTAGRILVMASTSGTVAGGVLNSVA
jgi:hypothetical protein